MVYYSTERVNLQPWMMNIQYVLNNKNDFAFEGLQYLSL